VSHARPPGPRELAIEPLGDAAVLVRFGSRLDAELNRWVHALAAALAAAPEAWMVDVVPAYATLAVHYDPAQFPSPPFAAVRVPDAIRECWSRCSSTSTGRGALVEVPVRYGDLEGPDLEAVAAHAGMAPEEVVRRHHAVEYRVAMLGFAPGFPYLLGLDAALAIPRLAQPRLRVEAGSVAIGGLQTGIYPHAGPGGWRVIGRTSLVLFDAARQAPSLLQPGDRVRFRPEAGA
jgi:KipI family sensor histidine kinase inhibitor